MDTGHHYEVKLNWQSERKGLMSSPVLNSNIEVATPPEFPKGIAGIWSPEHLLVAAVNSCLMTTFLAIAENSKFEFINFESGANGKLEKVDGKLMMRNYVSACINSFKGSRQGKSNTNTSKIRGGLPYL